MTDCKRHRGTLWSDGNVLHSCQKVSHFKLTMGAVYLQVCYTFKKGDRDTVLHPILRSAFLPLCMEYTCLLAGDLSVSRHTTRESKEGGVVVREAGPLLHPPQKQAQDCFLFLGFVTWCNQLLHHLLSSSFTFLSIELTIFLHFEHKENS